MNQPKNTPEAGTLFVVATPIGNLADASTRMEKTLRTVDLIAAEDTRHTRKLLTHLGISRPLLSLHGHNEAQKTAVVIERLLQGRQVALVTDAGTPLISDPGFPLVKEAQNIGIRVVPIPGPSAVITALSVSGIACDRFAFEGFLPAKANARLERLTSLSKESRTLVFYESPHRIKASIDAMIVAFGGARQATIARELTKLHEQIKTGGLQQLAQWLDQSMQHCKGEFVVVVEGAPCQTSPLEEALPILEVLLGFLPLKKAAQATSELSGHSRNALYKAALELKKQ